jgi:hypothetical protein
MPTIFSGSSDRQSLTSNRPDRKPNRVIVWFSTLRLLDPRLQLPISDTFNSSSNRFTIGAG